MDDDDFTDILLASIASSLESSYTSINASARLGKTALTPDIVIQLITDEYECKSKNKAETDQAFTADAKNKSKKNITCFNCDKHGHVKADCWAKGSRKEGQGPTHSR